MKILIRTSRERVERYYDLAQLPADWELIWAGTERDENKLLQMAGDASAMLVDAIIPVTGELIRQMPNLKIIHSEGVGFDQIDLETAASCGVFVCNNKGANAAAVAEQTLMLILAVLRHAVEGDMLVRTGRQIETKTRWMTQGLRELSELKVGLLGMGDIGRESAKRLRGFQCEIYYYNRTRLSVEEEKSLSVCYLPLDELLKACDIISLHLAANTQTVGIMDRAKFAMMKKDSILINTARGELVNQEDLIWALTEGQLAMAGLDCLSPEPVLPDNSMLQLPDELRHRVIFSPHVGGGTGAAFRRMHRTIWSNITAVSEGHRPINVVNQL